MRWRTMVCLLLAVAGSPELCFAADPRYPDWPCAQAKVPDLSLAAVWAGPPLDDVADKWKNDAKVSALLPRLAARRTPLDEAWQRIGFDRAVQGNLDPTLLLGPLDRVLAGADDVIARADGRPGHIFNLGHGLLPSTPLEHVQALARYVHQHTRR